MNANGPQASHAAAAALSGDPLLQKLSYLAGKGGSGCTEKTEMFENQQMSKYRFKESFTWSIMPDFMD